MKLKNLLLSLVLLSNIEIVAYAQTDSVNEDGTTQQRIKQVENSLRPLVLNKGQALWNLETQMLKYNISGLSIAVIHNYEIDWAKGYGATGSKEMPKVTEKTVFQAASMSKFVNAVAMMKLTEMERISLDEDINDYLTSWKFPYNKNSDTNPMTIRQLLSHTAGLSTHGFNGYKNSNNLPTIIQTLEGNKPANSDKVVQVQPSNQSFKYSGGGTIISQLILMDVANQPYEGFVHTNLLLPLTMNNSFYSIEFDKYTKNVAYGHTGKGKPLKNSYNIYPESAAAGLWTTPTDLAKLIIDIQSSIHSETGKILSQPSAEALLKPSLKNGNAALGLFTEGTNGETYLQHSGANRGFRGKLFFSSNKGNGVVIMVNGPNTEIMEEIIRSVASVYHWDGFGELLSAAELNLADLDLNKFIGTYTFDHREVDVSLQKGHLMLSEKGKWSSKLTALSSTQFVVDIVKPQATIEFVTGTNGLVSKCILTQGESTEWVRKE